MRTTLSLLGLVTFLFVVSTGLSCGSTSTTRDAGAGGGLGTGGGLGSSGGAAGGTTAGGTAGGRAGGSAGGSAGGTSGGASAGGAAGGSAGGAAGVDCGGSSCVGATPLCCAVQTGGVPAFACSASCPDAGAPLDCDSPDDCDADAGTPFCCASLDLAAGTFPACPTNALSSQCRATCTTTLALSCPTAGTARMCSHATTDCQASQKCCAFTQGTATIQLCVSGTLPCTNLP